MGALGPWVASRDLSGTGKGTSPSRLRALTGAQSCLGITQMALEPGRGVLEQQCGSSYLSLSCEMSRGMKKRGEKTLN